jgi:hypothetical protein
MASDEESVKTHVFNIFDTQSFTYGGGKGQEALQLYEAFLGERYDFKKT